MDNLAHTLVGAALGRAVGGRELPASGWIGANVSPPPKSVFELGKTVPQEVALPLTPPRTRDSSRRCQ